MTLTGSSVVLGVINGLSYAAVAMGLVLIYRASRFINFAQAEIGAVAVVILAKVVLDWHWPYWVGFAAALVIGVACGGLIELTVVRRLFKSSRLVLMIATIGVAELLLAVTQITQLQPNSLALTRQGYPAPTFPFHLSVGALILSGSDILTFIVVPAAAIVLSIFLRWSRYGRAIRAASGNADLARLSGISVRRMSTLVWLISGLLSTLAGILLAPKTFAGIAGLGTPGLSVAALVPAFGAALIARMTSLPQAFTAAIGIGIVESVALANLHSAGSAEVVVFLVLLGALLLRARDLGRTGDESGGIELVTGEARPLPREIAELRSVRRLRWGGIAVAVAISLLIPFIAVAGFNHQFTAFGLSITCTYCIAGLSLCLLTGWGGQVSLGQFALVGLGAFATARLVSHGLPFPLVLLIAGVIGAAISLVIGLPALRIQGLYLALTTLAFAVLAEQWMFTSNLVVTNPTGVYVSRPQVLSGFRAMYLSAAGITLLVVILLFRYRKAGPRRLLVAVRDNDRAARAWGISATKVRVLAFLMSGFLAAVAGVIFAYTQQNFDSTSFPSNAGLTVLSAVVVGGLGSIAGSIIGPLIIVAPTLLAKPSPLVSFLVSGTGLLIFLMYAPGGIMRVVYAARDGLAQWLARRELGLEPLPPIVPPLRMLAAVAVGRHVDAVGEVPVLRGQQVGRSNLTEIQDAAARRRRELEQAPDGRTGEPGDTGLNPWAPPPRKPERALTGSEAAPRDGAEGPDNQAQPLLRVQKVSVSFGGVHALSDASLEVWPGETVGLIGGNGAGKTTLLDCVSGYVRSQGGAITLFNRNVTHRSVTGRARMGVSRGFQDARLFSGLTVQETLMVASESEKPTRIGAALIGLPAAVRQEREKQERVERLIAATGLEAFQYKMINELSTGTRRVVELVSTLLERPRLLLLDEPSAGIAEAETEALGPLLRWIQTEIDCSILLIEHDMRLIRTLCDRVYALDLGRIIAEGSPSDVLNDSQVVASYLGGYQGSSNVSGQAQEAQAKR